MFATKKVHNKTVMEFLLVAFLSGVADIIPRRSLDFCLLKVKNYDIKNDNFYLKGKMYFNVYKTSFKYGLQIVTVPKEIDTIIQKWIKVSNNDYMLFSSTGTHLTSPQITRLLNGCFHGKNVSTDILRHVYLTNRFGGMPSINELQKVATAMGHNSGTQQLYIKKD